MFKLKAGNVIQKINKMDRKQARTIGAIVVVVFIALLMLASFMGKADDTSFDGMSTRGYDLAQMPFVNDEAEAYLLASKYPDMQGNESSFLYSAQEKEARQAQDDDLLEDEVVDTGEKLPGRGDSLEDESWDERGYGGRGYGGRGGGRGGTKIGQLGSARTGTVSGGGLNTTYGAPRGDFSPYQSQDKGTEVAPQLRTSDAKKALFQTAQASRAAAGLKDSKARNAAKALMGGNIKGSDAFTDKGVDLSKTDGLKLDTNAPVTSPDLSNLQRDLGKAAQDAKKKQEAAQNSFWDQMLSQMVGGLMNMGINALGNGINSMLGKAASAASTKNLGNDVRGFMNWCQSSATCKQSAEYGTLVKELFPKITPEQIANASNFDTLAKNAGYSNQKVRNIFKDNKESLVMQRDEGKEIVQLGIKKENMNMIVKKDYNNDVPNKLTTYAQEYSAAVERGANSQWANLLDTSKSVFGGRNQYSMMNATNGQMGMVPVYDQNGNIIGYRSSSY